MVEQTFDLHAGPDPWVDAVAEHLLFDNRLDADVALWAALHALRDSLPHDRALHLGMQIPIAIRKRYFQGWHLSPASEEDRCVQDFCGHVGEELPPQFPLDAKNITRAVFDVLLEQLDHQQVATLINGLPRPLQALWAAAARSTTTELAGGEPGRGP